MAKITTLRLSADETGIATAARLLREGQLVALPTETVYGLGADAANDRAVAAVYEAKGRPSFNPLIVHLAELEAVRALVHWSDRAEMLARAFWPGPLTMVLPLREGAPVSRLVTAGLDSLAVRMPAQPAARALLRAFGGPVAAPSANRSGQISPTRAEHVLAGLDGRIAAVLDDGPCAVGLESTILGLVGKPTLLRPGSIGIGALSKVLGVPVAERRDTEAISAPGQLTSHYAPNARVRLNATEWREGEARLGFGDVECDLNLSPEGDLVEAAANLFEYLHRLDASGAPVIAVSPVPHVGLGVAINDRLSRAAAPRDASAGR
ncbi:L-threonylcarbamoyladenylate synthase [Aestuariicoccus sp. MJ-SS9]|uniref:L-threonylcarbamoyladenylate synthase n=1 Tax=Aestuariicoccus sp. MJ-SS9 TaxID=3079855 RepID=UPI0029079DF0|nr:L-threonylcarbamoyladenylate synthase [Aestuariicoccus sp. MJ-SS9]MDU8913464.1 L-threonylcarbamoyladenylate synthase [Aestuariicoccus sp. MJ-SS9]